VAEINKIRQNVDALPGDRFLVLLKFSQPLNRGSVFLDRCVADPAVVRDRNQHGIARIGIAMAILAVEAA
jgi:hypothetical protein